MVKITLQLKILLECDRIHTMIVRLTDIMEFHHRRTAAHIDCLNYFAGLLGYHFPEHDNDKNTGPMRDAYAYANYAKYHPELNLSDARKQLYFDMHDEHHSMQPHHIGHYEHAADIPDVVLVEMVCDWHSANFEQNHVSYEGGAPNVREFFDTEMRHKKDWTDKQIAQIYEMIDFLEIYANFDDVMAIWRPLLAD